jgi:hypothetical protein
MTTPLLCVSDIAVCLAAGVAGGVLGVAVVVVLRWRGWAQ